jgi:hypothetical protein
MVEPNNKGLTIDLQNRLEILRFQDLIQGVKKTFLVGSQLTAQSLILWAARRGTLLEKMMAEQNYP